MCTLVTTQPTSNWLPDELLVKIFSQLQFEELLVVAQVCRQWSCVASDKLLWRKFFPPATLVDEDHIQHVLNVAKTGVILRKMVRASQWLERSSRCHCRMVEHRKKSPCVCGLSGIAPFAYTRRQPAAYHSLIGSARRMCRCAERVFHSDHPVPTDSLSRRELLSGVDRYSKYMRDMPQLTETDGVRIPQYLFPLLLPEHREREPLVQERFAYRDRIACRILSTVSRPTSNEADTEVDTDNNTKKNSLLLAGRRVGGARSFSRRLEECLAREKLGVSLELALINEFDDEGFQHNVHASLQPYELCTPLLEIQLAPHERWSCQFLTAAEHTAIVLRYTQPLGATIVRCAAISLTRTSDAPLPFREWHEMLFDPDMFQEPTHTLQVHSAPHTAPQTPIPSRVSRFFTRLCLSLRTLFARTATPHPATLSPVQSALVSQAERERAHLSFLDAFILIRPTLLESLAQIRQFNNE